MQNIITASFFTTVNKIKAQEALRFLLPWNWSKWQTGEYVNKLEQAVKSYIGLKYPVSFYRGRDALHISLKSLNIGIGDEVIIQPFTCVSVPNAVVACGAKPIYADIIGSSKFKVHPLSTDSAGRVKSSKFFDYNINPREIEKKITHKTQAVIVQHTFGVPCNIYQIFKICRRHNLYLIEDCAHALGAEYISNFKSLKAGSLGDIAIFSFGRDKIISGVSGGMLATNNKKIYNTVKKIMLRYNVPGKNVETDNYLPKEMATKLEILRCLLYEVVFYAGKILYSFYLGKIIIWIAQKLSLAPKILTKQEKQGIVNSRPIAPLSNILAKLAYLDFLKLDQYNKKRRQIAEIYYKGLKDIKEIVLPYNTNQHESEHEFARKDSGAVFLRFAIQVKTPQKLYYYLKKHRILVSNWYSHIIDPAGVDLSKVYYQMGVCPQAEKASQCVVNLPVHQNMSLNEAEYVVQKVREFFTK